MVSELIVIFFYIFIKDIYIYMFVKKIFFLLELNRNLFKLLCMWGRYILYGIVCCISFIFIDIDVLN